MCVVSIFATPCTVARQALLSMGSSRQEYWSGLPCPPPGNLQNPGIKPSSLASPALAGGFFPTVPPGKPLNSAGFHRYLAINPQTNVSISRNKGSTGLGSPWKGLHQVFLITWMAAKLQARETWPHISQLKWPCLASDPVKMLETSESNCLGRDVADTAVDCSLPRCQIKTLYLS